MSVSTLLNEQKIDEVIRLIYQAALDSDAWVQVMAQLAHSLNSPVAAVWTHNFDSSGVSSDPHHEMFRSVGFDPDFLGSFASHYTYTNVWTQNENDLAEGVPVTSEMLFPEKRLGGTEFYGDWLRPQNLRHALGGVVARDGNFGLKVSLMRSPQMGEYRQEECVFYGRLLPHFKQACRLGRQLAQQREAQLCNVAQSTASQWALQSTHLAVLAISARGQLMHANPRAEAMIRNGLWIQVQHGQLVMANPSQHGRWQALLKDVVTLARPGHMRLDRADQEQPCFVTLIPSLGFEGSGRPPIYLCLISDGSQRRVASAHQLMCLFDLSPSEARLVRDLAQGLGIDEHASLAGIKRTTAKTHLQHAFAKTGTSTQRELIRLVLALPAVR